MLRLRITLPSMSLLRPVEIAAALPTRFNAGAEPCRTVWALHCAMSNGDFFFDRLDVSSLVDRERTAIVAPSMGNGYFINSCYEQQADCLQEIFLTLQERLSLSPRREDNLVAGVSMGAFGALRWALTSENFGGAAAISGVFDCRVPLDERLRGNRAQRALHAAFSSTMRRMLLDEDGATRPEADFERLLPQAAGDLDIAFYCGRQDYLSLPQTLHMERLCRRLGRPAALCLTDGEHDDRYWKDALRDAVTAYFRKRNDARGE